MNLNFVNDPENCPWISSFKVEISRPLVFNPFALNVHYSLETNHPEATLYIASGKSLPLTKSDWAKANKHPIPANQVTDHFSIHLNEEDLDKVWEIKVQYNIDHETYQFIRRVFFSEVDVNIEEASMFPEKQHHAYKDRVDTGVCFSGGGTRSLVLSMGQMRFLHNNGYTKDIGYFSSVSGGSWAASIYTFAKENNIEKLLGKYTEVKNYKTLIDKAENPNMTFGANKGYFGVSMYLNLLFSLANYVQKKNEDISKNEKFYRELGKLIQNTIRVPFDRIWIESVGTAFFANNGIFSLFNAMEESFTLDEASKEAILNNKGSLQDHITFFYEANAKRQDGIYPPYYIANSLILRPTNGKTKSYVPYEYTPLYQGAGFNGRWKTGLLSSIQMGGGSIPMFAYDTDVISTVKNNKVWVMRQSINSKASLATASGTSSAAFAGATSGASGHDFIGIKDLLTFFGAQVEEETKHLLTG